MTAAFVTCWYDLERRGLPAGRRDFAVLGRPVLELPRDMVVFCDPELADQVRAIRGDAGRTLIVDVPFEDIPGAHSDRRIATAKLPSNPAYHTGAFLTRGWVKPAALGVAAKMRPFGATHLVLIDLGIGHVLSPDDIRSLSEFEPCGNRVSVHLTRAPWGIVDRPDFFNWVWCMAAGGFRVGPIKECIKFSEAFEAEAGEALESGHVACQDDLLARIIGKSRLGTYRHTFGNYTEILSNHGGVRKNLEHVAWMMRDARSRELWQFNLAVGTEVLRSHRNGVIEDDDVALESALTEMFVAAYYVDKRESSKLRDIYLGLVDDRPTFRDAYRSHRDVINNNFGLLAAEGLA